MKIFRPIVMSGRLTEYVVNFYKSVNFTTEKFSKIMVEINKGLNVNENLEIF